MSTPHVAKYSNEVWRLNVADETWTWISGDKSPPLVSYDTNANTILTASRQPLPRLKSACYYNASTSTLFLSGGMASVAFVGAGPIGDIWQFNVNFRNWSLVGGNYDFLRTGPVFGTRGVEAPTNSMGSFYGAVMFQYDNALYVHYGGLSGIGNCIFP